MAKFKKYETGKSQELVINITAMLPSNHLVFFVENCVSKLDTTSMESSYSEKGRNGFHPKLLLSILFYGYMQGIRSGRKIAENCEENIGFIYLSKSYFPKKSVINDFRRLQHHKFHDLFLQVLRMFDELEKDGSTMFSDGSKIRANASIKRTKTKAKCEEWLETLSEDIAELEEQEITLSAKKKTSPASRDEIESRSTY